MTFSLFLRHGCSTKGIVLIFQGMPLTAELLQPVNGSCAINDNVAGPGTGHVFITWLKVQFLRKGVSTSFQLNTIYVKFREKCMYIS